MYKGKKVCETLKVVRKQIADANEIPYEVTECHHQGRCPGTCPKCESEVRYIENQIQLRRAAGKVVAIVGLSLGVANVYAAQSPSDLPEISIEKIDSAAVKDAKFQIRGIVMDEENEPIHGALVLVKDSKSGVQTDEKGHFFLPVNFWPAEIEVRYVGYKTYNTKVSDAKDLSIKLEGAEALMGEVVIVKSRKTRLSRWLHYKHKHRR